MIQEIKKIGGGLKPTPKDARDFKLGQIIKWPKLEELPENFALEPISVKNQGDTDYCTAFATCGMSELQEGVELSPEWSFAVSKQISGDPESYGQDIRTALKVHTKYGAVEKSEAPYSVENDEDAKIRYINNWPQELFEKAGKHQKQSYFKIEGWPKGWDAFDAIRTAIWLFRDLKRAVAFGVLWSWQLSNVFLEDYSPTGCGHCVYLRGWNKHIEFDNYYLLLQNSYGKEAGGSGTHLISRNVVNDMAEKFGAYMFIDIPPEIAKQKVWSPFRRLLEAIKKFFSEL